MTSTNTRENRLIFVVAVAVIFAYAFAPTLVDAGATPPVIGNWAGTLSAGGQTFHVAIHFAASKGGGISGTMDSIDQGANGVPLSNVSYKEPKVHFELEGAAPGVYDGIYNKPKDEIAGTWQKAGMNFELDLKRTK